MFFVLYDPTQSRYVCEFDRIGIIHSTASLERALRYDTMTELVGALRATPDVALGRQNELEVHRAESVQMPPQLMDQGAV